MTFVFRRPRESEFHACIERICLEKGVLFDVDYETDENSNTVVAIVTDDLINMLDQRQIRELNSIK